MPNQSDVSPSVLLSARRLLSVGLARVRRFNTDESVLAGFKEQTAVLEDNTKRYRRTETTRRPYTSRHSFGHLKTLRPRRLPDRKAKWITMRHHSRIGLSGY